MQGLSHLQLVEEFCLPRGVVAAMFEIRNDLVLASSTPQALENVVVVVGQVTFIAALSINHIARTMGFDGEIARGEQIRYPQGTAGCSTSNNPRLRAITARMYPEWALDSAALSLR